MTSRRATRYPACELHPSTASGPRVGGATYGREVPVVDETESALSEAATIVRRYIELVGAHDLAPLGELFADDLVATTSGGTFTKAEWIAALDRLLPILERNDIREIFEGEPSTSSGVETAAVFYDFVTDTDAGAVPCAEWITLKDGRITTVELIFEQAKWSHVVAALKERSAK